MNDQVVLVLVVIIAVFVLISIVYSKINKTRQGDIEREKLLRIKHEKQVAELKHLLLNKKREKGTRVKSFIE
jgi:ABC-type siderophore export system fused ATPase/permease subunit